MKCYRSSLRAGREQYPFPPALALPFTVLAGYATAERSSSGLLRGFPRLSRDARSGTALPGVASSTLSPGISRTAGDSRMHPGATAAITARCNLTPYPGLMASALGRTWPHVRTSGLGRGVLPARGRSLASSSG
jgi:hypothetical protein